MNETDSDRPTRLAAIVFTDIAGYSRMMEQDEELTIRVLKQHNEIVLPLVRQAHGEVIDAIGDGLFILFPSVREAVVCSTAIHNAIGAHNETAEPDRRFRLRIGIHLGEIWRDGDRVYGNGVNVAARVQPMARPGGICITEDVYRQVVNKLSSTIESIGVHELKNISRRLELYHVITGHEQSAPRGEETGEFDAIKQRILREREAIAARHAEHGRSTDSSASGDEPSIERRIESKVFSVVERVMDTAITKWEQMPEEKKSRAIARIQEAITKEAAGDVAIHLGDSKRSKGSNGDSKSEGGEVLSRLGPGIVFGTGFGIGYFMLGIGWMIWPFAILGLLPLGSGILRALKMLARSERRRRERPLQLERLLLQTAKRTGGTLTVVQAASETGIPLDEVQLTLDRMTTKGYVAQQIRESGIIEYEFPSLTE